MLQCKRGDCSAFQLKSAMWLRGYSRLKKVGLENKSVLFLLARTCKVAARHPDYNRARGGRRVTIIIALCVHNAVFPCKNAGNQSLVCDWSFSDRLVIGCPLTVSKFTMKVLTGLPYSRKIMSKDDEENAEPINKRPRLNKSPFRHVPDEVLLFIFRYLDSPDLLNCRAVSRTWYELSNVLLRSRKSRTAPIVDDQAKSPRFAEFTTERMVEGEPSLHQLPDELILHLFTFLDPLELLNCSKVCKLWYNVSRNALLSVRSIVFNGDIHCKLSYDNFRTKTIYCPEERTAEALHTFQGIVKDVQCDISMKTLAALNKLTNLKSLSLWCVRMSIAVAHAAAIYLPNTLESLYFNDLNNQHGVEDRVCEIISNQPFLQNLVKEYSNFNSVKQLSQILKKLPLRELSFNFFGFPVEINKIFASVTGLERFSVGGSFLVNSAPLPHFNNLKNLEIQECDNLDDKSLESLLSRMPNLRRLKFHQCPNITGKSIAKTLQGIPIKRITFEGFCRYVENDTILKILLAFINSLEQLTLPYSSCMIYEAYCKQFPPYPNPPET
eukprot:sb/3463589/